MVKLYDKPAGSAVIAIESPLHIVSPEALVSIVATGSLATSIVTDAVYVQPPPGVVTSKAVSYTHLTLPTSDLV